MPQPSLAFSTFALFAALLPGQAQDARITSQRVAAGVHMLIGRGGNIGVSVGEDGAFIIDDQFAPMVGQIKAAVAKLTDAPIRFVLNTHWHGDHTGGNERLGKTGSVIVAHANVRKRMSTDQFMKAFNRTVKAAPTAALPVVTFTRDMMLHYNGDDVELQHLPNAHTDGDVVIRFKKANVIHMGDVFFHERYPFIDIGSGGSVDGLIAAVERALGLCNDKTKVIPGHGPLSDKKGLASYRAMLVDVRAQVEKMIAAGKSADDVLAAKPTAKYDAECGNPERFLRIVHESLRQAAERKKFDKRR